MPEYFERRDCGVAITIAECVEILGMHPEEIVEAEVGYGKKILCRGCEDKATAAFAELLTNAQRGDPYREAPTGNSNLEGDSEDLDWIDVNMAMSLRSATT